MSRTLIYSQNVIASVISALRVAAFVAAVVFYLAYEPYGSRATALQPISLSRLATERKMFEAYSERARQAIFIARLEAGQRGAGSVSVDDLIAALIMEDQGVMDKTLLEYRNFPAAFPFKTHRSFFSSELASELLPKIEHLLPRYKPVPTSQEIPVSPELKRVLGDADELRKRFQHKQIEPLHLLAAAVAEESSKGAQTLREAGITQEKVVEAIQREADESKS